jgi:putative acetyltransferase
MEDGVATERREQLAVTVRGAKRNDALALWEVYTCPGVVRGTLQLPYQSPDELERRLGEALPGTYRLVAEVDGRVVGSLGLHVGRGRQAHVAHLGMMVHDAYQGRGAGTALLAAAVELAERWLGVHRMELEVYPDNAPALGLYRKFGFEVEGTKRRYALRDGEWVDALVMARLSPLPSSRT